MKTDQGHSRTLADVGVTCYGDRLARMQFAGISEMSGAS